VETKNILTAGCIENDAADAHARLSHMKRQNVMIGPCPS